MGRHLEAEAGARADSLRPTVSVFCGLLVQLQGDGGNREGPKHSCKGRASGSFAEHIPFSWARVQPEGAGRGAEEGPEDTVKLHYVG